MEVLNLEIIAQIFIWLIIPLLLMPVLSLSINGNLINFRNFLSNYNMIAVEIFKSFSEFKVLDFTLYLILMLGVTCIDLISGISLFGDYSYLGLLMAYFLGQIILVFRYSGKAETFNGKRCILEYFVFFLISTILFILGILSTLYLNGSSDFIIKYTSHVGESLNFMENPLAGVLVLMIMAFNEKMALKLQSSANFKIMYSINYQLTRILGIALFVSLFFNIKLDHLNSNIFLFLIGSIFVGAVIFLIKEFFAATNIKDIIYRLITIILPISILGILTLIMVQVI